MRSSIQEAYEQIYLKEFNATSAVDKALSNFGAANKPAPKPAPVMTSKKPTGTSGAAALGSMSISSPASARPTPTPVVKPTPTPAASAPVRPTPTSPSTPTLSARAQALKAGGPMSGRRMLNQDFNIFDVIKGYLLDEGYADTERAALVIMSNMSEEWRQSIVG